MHTSIRAMKKVSTFRIRQLSYIKVGNKGATGTRQTLDSA